MGKNTDRQTGYVEQLFVVIFYNYFYGVVPAVN